MTRGMVYKLHRDKGFGFLRGFAGGRYFFHRSAVADHDFDGLAEGDPVRFEPGAGPKGSRLAGATSSSVRCSGNQSRAPVEEGWVVSELAGYWVDRVLHAKPSIRGRCFSAALTSAVLSCRAVR